MVISSPILMSFFAITSTVPRKSPQILEHQHLELDAQKSPEVSRSVDTQPRTNKWNMADPWALFIFVGSLDPTRRSRRRMILMILIWTKEVIRNIILMRTLKDLLLKLHVHTYGWFQWILFSRFVDFVTCGHYAGIPAHQEKILFLKTRFQHATKPHGSTIRWSANGRLWAMPLLQDIFHRQTNLKPSLGNSQIRSTSELFLAHTSVLKAAIGIASVIDKSGLRTLHSSPEKLKILNETVNIVNDLIMVIDEQKNTNLAVNIVS